MSRLHWLALLMIGIPLAVIYGMIRLATELPRTKDTRTSKLFAPQDVTVPEPPPDHVVGTAYCPCQECCGKWALADGGGFTASGAPAEQGVTIAADWSVFPEGTCLLIRGIGRRIVQDTGSAIKGARIDIFFDSHEDAKEFGVKRKLAVTQC